MLCQTDKYSEAGKDKAAAIWLMQERIRLMLIPSDKAEIEAGHEYETYKINDEMYESCLTSKHDELVNLQTVQTLT